jgi:nucleotide-binding universal stress UspA family protein
MSDKRLLTHVPCDREFTSHLEMTAGVARRLGLDVVGLGAEAPWPYPDDQHTGSSDFKRILASTKADIAVAAELFRDAFNDEALVATSWREQVGYPDNVVPRHARVADLVVAYRNGVAEASVYARPDNLVMACGAPVLLLPRRTTAFSCERILLAWKNTRETRRALLDALPVLKLASRVLVAAICGDAEVANVEAELADVADRLTRQGVKGVATLVEVGARGADGVRLLRLAGIEESDLIVAGGYGHSRLHEWALGGVTQDLIAHDERYVLLSH